MKTSLHQFFSQLPDPRIHRNKKHLLIDIVILTIIAVLCGAESWDSIEMFGKSKKDFLSKFLKLPNGIPSHDTINRVFSLIRAERFERLFIKWAQSLKDSGISKEVIAVDGKTIRGSRDSYHDKSGIHLVNAWANSNGLVLGQIESGDKISETAVIPELLKILDIEGCIITMDALYTQKRIAQNIVEQEADYILAVKDNQGYLKENVESAFLNQKPDSVDTSIEKGHGRIETRTCEMINMLDLFDVKEQWEGLKSLARVTAQREIRDKLTTEVRLYISSVQADAKDFNSFIRQHWAVENSLHWTLDVTFREDAQRKRNGKAAQNFALVQKIALNLLKKEESKRMSLKNKRLVAAWDNEFLLKILTI
jgi:predicted transposase YbfD/YdcC